VNNFCVLFVIMNVPKMKLNICSLLKKGFGNGKEYVTQRVNCCILSRIWERISM